MEKEKAYDRRTWPVRVYVLGEEPRDDLEQSTTAEERLAMVWALTLESWALAGWTLPTYSRYEIPISVRPLGGNGSAGRRP